MFEYRYALVRSRDPNSFFEEKDVSDVKMNVLHNNYSKVFVIVDHPVYNEERAFDLDDVEDHLRPRDSTLTLREWLVSIGDYSLPLLDAIPRPELTYARWFDAWQSEFDIKPVHRTMHHDMDVPFEEKHDIRISHSKVDAGKLYRECIFTVNGFFHRSNYSGEGVHLIDGGKSGKCANVTQVGVYRLGELGEVRLAPVRNEQVHRGHDEQPMSEVVYVELDPDVEVENKTILMSIGGYLTIPGRLVNRAGKRYWMVDMRDFPLAQRYFEMKRFIDVSGLERYLTKSTVNPDQMALSEFYSDTFIRALFTMSQTFFIIIDTPDMVIEKDLVEFDGLPRRFLARQEPVFPLFGGMGRAYEYVSHKELDRFVIATDDVLKENYLLETTDWKNMHSVDSSRTPYKLQEYSPAFFLKVGSYVGYETRV